MNNTKTADKDIWIKASVIGSLWASVEIIMGSFFHNLQLPFAGTMLAFFTVAFVVSVLQIWPSRGLIWRAGLICAIMKSISPSAVILGPMTGIFLEAVLIEIFVFLFGRNILGYIIAGIMAMLSVLFHKIFTLLIIYGWDAVKILSNLYHFAMKQLHVSNINPMHAIWILVSVYVFLGIISAVFGYFIGKKADRIKNEEKRTVDLKFSEADDFLFLSDDQKFSVSLLFVNIVLVVSGLFIINRYGLYPGLAFAVFYVLFNMYRYKNALRQFKRPFLWIQLITLTILAWLFYMDDGKINFFNPEGLVVGIEMAIRAIIVILGFSAISVELRNPIIKTVLYKKGFSNFYNALGLAFSALPAVISNISKPKEIIKKPFDTIINILLYTDSLYIAFSESEQQKISIITGKKHSGKTTLLQEKIKELRDQGISVGGLLSIGSFKNNTRYDFKLQDISTGEMVDFLSRKECNICEKIGRFYIDPKAFDFGTQVLKRCLKDDVQTIVLDEIGPLELENKGWALIIPELLASGSDLILTIREDLVKDVIMKWNINTDHIFRTG